MPKPSKKDLSDSDSGPEDRNPVPTKKRKSDAEDTFELSKMRQVSVSDFKGKGNDSELVYYTLIVITKLEFSF